MGLQMIKNELAIDINGFIYFRNHQIIRKFSHDSIIWSSVQKSKNMLFINFMCFHRQTLVHPFYCIVFVKFSILLDWYKSCMTHNMIFNWPIVLFSPVRCNFSFWFTIERGTWEEFKQLGHNSYLQITSALWKERLLGWFSTQTLVASSSQLLEQIPLLVHGTMEVNVCGSRAHSIFVQYFLWEVSEIVGRSW